MDEKNQMLEIVLNMSWNGASTGLVRHFNGATIIGDIALALSVTKCCFETAFGSSWVE